MGTTQSASIHSIFSTASIRKLFCPVYRRKTN